MNDKIISRLKQLIAEELDVNLKAEDIDETVSLFEDGIGLDSVVIMEFIMLIEGKFGFQFDDSELNIESFRNLQKLADLIAAKLDEGKV